MAFFDDVKKLGKNIAEKSKDVVEITKLNGQINSEKDKMKDLYVKIGEQAYINYKNGGESQYTEHCAQIAEIEAKIGELTNKVLEIKNASKCPTCGAEVSKDTAFCSKCGTKVNG